MLFYLRNNKNVIIFEESKNKRYENNKRTKTIRKRFDFLLTALKENASRIERKV